MYLWHARESKQARRTIPEGKNLIDQDHDEDAHFALLQESLHRLKLWVTTLIVLLVLVAAALVLVIANASSQHTSKPESQSPVPPMPLTQTTFELNPLYAGRSSPSRDEAWSSLTPPGDGFILLPNATAQGTYNLPLGNFPRPSLRYLALPPVALSGEDPRAPPHAASCHGSREPGRDLRSFA
ncbi:hypothetical protein LTR02_002369 [Friedmanniomyces endolithicus]|nr:hypothetical protein LTR02_002369 [Friedmanniomyces endolithicus]